MLISLLVLVAALFWNGMPLLSSGQSVADTSGDSLLRPEDPSTLTLALIGAGTVAVYLATRRAARSNAAAIQQHELRCELPPEEASKSSVGQEEQPSRGAA
jgi:hypothetical protein